MRLPSYPSRFANLIGHAATTAAAPERPAALTAQLTGIAMWNVTDSPLEIRLCLCNLDDTPGKDWQQCQPTQTLQRAARGQHTFVQAMMPHLVKT